MRIFQLSVHEIPYCHFLHFLIIIFVSSNNARWIPEFRILFVLHGSRTVLPNLSLLICTTLYNYYSIILSHLEILTQCTLELLKIN
jgi:hypothetical protein